MTDAEAKTEAQRRWGPNGTAWHNPLWYEDYKVGVDAKTPGVRLEFFGVGQDYEEAFADATAKGH